YASLAIHDVGPVGPLVVTTGATTSFGILHGAEHEALGARPSGVIAHHLGHRHAARQRPGRAGVIAGNIVGAGLTAHDADRDLRVRRHAQDHVPLGTDAARLGSRPQHSVILEPKLQEHFVGGGHLVPGDHEERVHFFMHRDVD